MNKKTKAKILLGSFIVSGILMQMNAFSELYALGGKKAAALAAAASQSDSDSEQIIDSYGNTPLHKAAWSGDLDKFKFIVSRYGLDLDINRQNNNGDTVLHAAIWSGNLKLVKFILENFCVSLNLDIKNKQGLTPFGITQEVINGAVINAAVKYESSKTEDGTFSISKKRCLSVVDALRMQRMMRDADTPLKRKMILALARPWGPYTSTSKPNAVTFSDHIYSCITKNTANTIVYSKPLLYWAAHDNDNKLVKCLIDNGASLPSDKRERNEIIFNIIFYGDVKQLYKLLSTAHPSFIDDVRSDALVFACDELWRNPQDHAHYRPPELFEKIQYLIEQQRVNPNVFRLPYSPTDHSRTLSNPLLSAAESGDVDVVRLLIDYGANVNVKDEFGCSPLHYAVRHPNSELTHLLIEHGSDINAVDEHGSTPLYEAIYMRRNDSAKLLLENGANPDIRNNDGDTALHIAANYLCNKDLANLLLIWGADPNVENNIGQKPNLNWSQRTFAPHQLRKLRRLFVPSSVQQYFAHPSEQNDLA